MTDEDEDEHKLKSWTAQGPGMMHAHDLKKLTALHGCPAAQINGMLTAGTQPD